MISQLKESYAAYHQTWPLIQLLSFESAEEMLAKLLERNPNLRVYNPQPKPKHADAAAAASDSGSDGDMAAVAEQARRGAAGPLERAQGNSERRESPQPMRAGSAVAPAEAAPLLKRRWRSTRESKCCVFTVRGLSQTVTAARPARQRQL